MSTRAEKRRANAAAAKQRKQMILAGVLLGVLAILVVIQGPKLLDALGGSDGSSEALPVTPVVPAPTDENNGRGRPLRFKGGGGDPFLARALANNDPSAGAVSGPSGTKDPFVKTGGSGSSGSSGSSSGSTPDPVAQPLPKRIVIGTPTVNAKAKRGWIVVIASIQTRVGRRYADRFAARVRLSGLKPVSVLDSSTRRPLRSGYYVVYTGPFATIRDVQRSAAHVHAFGYRTAYVREILRY